MRSSVIWQGVIASTLVTWLALGVVAEGVETADQLANLRARQVRYAQGWFFAQAMPAQAFISYVGDQPQPTPFP